MMQGKFDEKTNKIINENIYIKWLWTLSAGTKIKVSDMVANRAPTF